METADFPVRTVDPDSVQELLRTAEELLAGPGMLERLPSAAAALSERVRGLCRPCDTPDGLYVLRGLPIDDAAIGPTPEHWSRGGESAAVWDAVVLLLASVMGRPIAWEGQQDGRFVHDIVPTPGQETVQTGASSTVLLSPHTEDAFHPARAHLLMLCCMRNHDRVPTTAASVRRTRLPEEDVALLSGRVLPILPDDSYAEARGSRAEPPKVPTLWRSPEGLTLRFDPAYTPLEDAPPGHRAAYARLEEELARVTVPVALNPGDLLVVDNDVVVHGRVPFVPRYDGTDRWLKRASVRVPGRRTRPLEEEAEHGYGQAVLVAPA